MVVTALFRISVPWTVAILVRGPGRSVSTTLCVADPIAVSPAARTFLSVLTDPSLSSVRFRPFIVTLPVFFIVYW